MANMIRSAKSGNNWNANDLVTYNITVTAQPPEQFFRGNPSPPLTGVDPSLIDSAVDDKNTSDATCQYLFTLDLANRDVQENSLGYFAGVTLRALGFEERRGGTFMSIGNKIPLMICGDDRPTQTDGCLEEWRLKMFLLVLQADKTSFNASDPEPQVIAEAIAVFQYNNRTRKNLGLPTLDAMTIPCITMVGTRPTFYLVPVTVALSIAVATGQYPKAQTTVVKCVTSLGHNRNTEGMETPAYRRVAFQRFIAFKDLAKEYWQTFIV